MTTIKSPNEIFIIATDKEKLDVHFIHDYLANQSEWSKGIPLERVIASIESSLNFGLYYRDKQIGYARIISDYATIAYLGDVFIISEYQGLGLSKLLMKEIMEHPKLQGLRRWILLTDSADWLYEKFGFKKIPNPEFYMENFNPKVFKD